MTWGTRRRRRSETPSKGTQRSDENLLKHLEFIQHVVARLAANSFMIKGWSLTISTAVYGFAAKESNPGIAIVGFLPTLVFWILDAYYLFQERLFRRLYDATRDPGGQVEPFSMHAEHFRHEISGWGRTMWNKTIWPYYVTSLVVGFLTVLATGDQITKSICWFLSRVS